MPPAEDPDVGYPEDPDFVFGQGSDSSVRPPLEGFDYNLSPIASFRDINAAEDSAAAFAALFFGGGVLDGKLAFSFTPTEVYGSWCALQTAETCDYTSWGVDDEGNCFGGDGIAPADCQKVSLCTSQVCECAPGFPCSASSERLSELTIRLSDDGAVGLFSGAVFVNERGFQQPLGTVHFRRAEPSDLAPDAAP